MRPFILPALLPALVLAAPAKRDDACPTMTFTYEGVVITAPYTGPGAPQSCLTPAATAVAPCPTMTFTYEGAVITAPYQGPGTPQSCLTSSTPVQTSVLSVGSSATESKSATETGPGDGGPSVTTSNLVAPTTSATSSSSAIASSSSSSSSSTSGIAKGFNYGSAGMDQASFETQFNLARNLVGTSGFTSARLYTMIQDGTTNGVISAIPAAIATQTKLLLGLFYPNVDNELAALTAAAQQYGTQFTDLVLGISVGSEDLYRNSPTGIENHSNPGANPDDIVNFIQATRNAIAGTALVGKLIGHVDTWTAYVNGSNNAVISACDFLGVDAYPYFQNTQANGIANGQSLFEDAYQATVAVAQGKPVWITETGWPVSGPVSGQATASTADAQSYWKSVGCGFAFDKIPTFWYDLVDGGASPSFGVTAGTTTPLYDLSCSS